MAIHRYSLSFICPRVLPDLGQRLLSQPLTATSFKPFAFSHGANDLFLKKEKELLLPQIYQIFLACWIFGYLLALSDPNC